MLLGKLKHWLVHLEQITDKLFFENILFYLERFLQQLPNKSVSPAFNLIRIQDLLSNSFSAHLEQVRGYDSTAESSDVFLCSRNS